MEVEVNNNNSANCLDCGKPYSEFGVDLVFNSSDWFKIHPRENGLLCANCIANRVDLIEGIVCIKASLKKNIKNKIMRGIKFRIWNGLVMVYEVTVGIHGIFYTNGISTEDSASLDNTTMYPQSTPLMQFTGLKDKNGKEIFEGDILKSKGATEPEEKGFLVKFDICRFRFLNINFLDVDSEIYEIHTDDLGFISEQLEIIGNIHENPELLK